MHPLFLYIGACTKGQLRLYGTSVDPLLAYYPSGIVEICTEDEQWLTVSRQSQLDVRYGLNESSCLQKPQMNYTQPYQYSATICRNLGLGYAGNKTGHSLSNYVNALLHVVSKIISIIHVYISATA